MHAPARLEVGVKPELKLNITFNQFACQKPVSPRLRKSKTCNETLTPSYGVKNYPEYLFIKVIRRANGMFHCSPGEIQRPSHCLPNTSYLHNGSQCPFLWTTLTRKALLAQRLTTSQLRNTS